MPESPGMTVCTATQEPMRMGYQGRHATAMHRQGFCSAAESTHVRSLHRPTVMSWLLAHGLAGRLRRDTPNNWYASGASLRGPVRKAMAVQAPPPVAPSRAVSEPAPAPEALGNTITVSSVARLCSSARLRKWATVSSCLNDESR